MSEQTARSDVLPNDNLGELAAALAKAQAVIKPAAMDRANTHLKSKYATLTSVWEACREALTTNGIAVVQLPMMVEDGWLGMETRLIHSSGQSISSMFRAPIQIPLSREGNPILTEVQAYGSAITYMRRYALAAMVGVVTDEDGDGHSEGHSAPRQQQQRRPEPQQQRQAPPESSGDRAATNGQGAAPAGAHPGYKPNGQCLACHAPTGAKHAGPKCPLAGQVNNGGGSEPAKPEAAPPASADDGDRKRKMGEVAYVWQQVCGAYGYDRTDRAFGFQCWSEWLGLDEGYDGSTPLALEDVDRLLVKMRADLAEIAQAGAMSAAIDRDDATDPFADVPATGALPLEVPGAFR